MKSLKRSILAILVGVTMSVSAFAQQPKKEKVTFGRDMVVNGTLVKKGTYQIAVDEQSSELQLMQDKKVIASTKFTAESRTEKNKRTVVTFSAKDNSNVLGNIALKGENSLYVVGDNNQAAKPQQ